MLISPFLIIKQIYSPILVWSKQFKPCMFLDCAENCSVWSLVNHFQQNRSCVTLLKRICVNKHRSGMKEEWKYEHRGKFLTLINLKKTKESTNSHLITSALFEIYWILKICINMSHFIKLIVTNIQELCICNFWFISSFFDKHSIAVIWTKNALLLNCAMDQKNWIYSNISRCINVFLY